MTESQFSTLCTKIKTKLKPHSTGKKQANFQSLNILGSEKDEVRNCTFGLGAVYEDLSEARAEIKKLEEQVLRKSKQTEDLKMELNILAREKEIEVQNLQSKMKSIVAEKENIIQEQKKEIENLVSKLKEYQSSIGVAKKRVGELENTAEEKRKRF
eukprot:TRINITY_DN9908_c0_g1_i6.p1 TRINITY_DN9908_c0_g1~~TRINITY_DN9908_c0_g1_i6.p1  ORF type:complete len:165 (-),score=34.77 TRINITY_DN9908_c0_g1_i6:182-649(-)